QTNGYTVLVPKGLAMPRIKCNFPNRQRLRRSLTHGGRNVAAQLALSHFVAAVSAGKYMPYPTAGLQTYIPYPTRALCGRKCVRPNSIFCFGAYFCFGIG